MAETLGVTIVPAIVTFGGESYPEYELSTEEFWRKAEACHPRTSQPSPGAFAKAFEPLVRAGHNVLCLAVTSKHSGTHNSACTAAQQFDGRVTVLDTLSVSWGMGCQVLAAHQATQSGKSIPEIAEALRDLRHRSHILLVLDTIGYLEKGGRASRLVPVVRQALQVLKVKPILSLADGELKLSGVARSLQRGLARVMNELASLQPLEALAVVHVRAQQRALALADRLASQSGFPRDQVVVIEAGSALSSHGGPGLVGAMATTM
jgi:DegV family protein with EDD domain